MPVLLIEPTSQPKRHHLSEALRGAEGRSDLTLESVEKRLRAIRDDSLANSDALIAQLIAGAWSGVDLTVAADARQAVETVLRVSGRNEIAVNRSSVVANELVPVLSRSGRQVLMSYEQEFIANDCGTIEYWQLPGMMLESRFRSFQSVIDLAASRASSLDRDGMRDFVALLGVNAVSADGTILLLQHMQNIRRLFEHAREVIFVAGLDKVVRTAADALFQTQCMAVFGSEVLPLSFGAKQGVTGGEAQPARLPAGTPTGRPHLILLDNGRRWIMQSGYRELLACIDCRACTKGCPGSRFFAENARWTPKEYLHFLLAGKHQSLDHCLQCKTCQANCPLHIDLPTMIVTAKAELAKRRRRSLTDALLSRGGSMERWGSRVAPLANATFENRGFRRLGDALLGISGERHFPPMSRCSFSRWFASRATGETGRR
jgi:L-lactate utilization protein LutB